jgi:hypothetical protein
LVEPELDPDAMGVSSVPAALLLVLGETVAAASDVPALV